MTRTLAHSLYLLAEGNNWNFKLWSLYDSPSDLMEKYLPAKNFWGFGLNRFRFLVKTLIWGTKHDLVILSHINLALVGLVIKTINPKCKIWLIAHGIEVWRPLSRSKKMLLQRCDKIVCVSSFTRKQMLTMHHARQDQLVVLNNAVDPFMKLPEFFVKPEHLLRRYRINEGDPVIFTLTRLASTEQYKGHDQVIKIISSLKGRYPNIKYFLAGQYDHKEEIRIQKLITEYQVDKEVILTGFLEEQDITDYFLIADLFVLPSKKEGFGIVFIEALACGVPVICGNSDGSTDAICNGLLGKSIDPDDRDQLEKAVISYLDVPLTAEDRHLLQSKCMDCFNENDYMEKLKKMILND